MSLTTLLDALAAKEGQAYFPEFLAYMTALNTALQDASVALMLSVQTTSTTSRTLGTGSFTFTVEAGKLFVTGMPVRVAYNVSNYMDAAVSSYSGTTLVVSVAAADDVTGSGTYAAWTISMTGDEGPAGEPGTNGAPADMADSPGAMILNHATFGPWSL